MEDPRGGRGRAHERRDRRMRMRGGRVVVLRVRAPLSLSRADRRAGREPEMKLGQVNLEGRRGRGDVQQWRRMHHQKERERERESEQRHQKNPY